MKHRLFTLLSALSLLLCVGALLGWGRSKFYSDRIRYVANSPPGAIEVTSNDGELSVFLFRVTFYEGVAVTFDAGIKSNLGRPVFSEAGDAGILGFVFFHHVPRTYGSNDDEVGTSEAWFVGIRYWSITAIMSLLPAIWSWRRFRDRSRGVPANACVHCGYDLRATPDRCPECGAVPELKT